MKLIPAQDPYVSAAIGVGLMITAVVLYWSLYPRGGNEALLMKAPGAWILLPLVIILCLLSGGSVLYTQFGQ